MMKAVHSTVPSICSSGLAVPRSHFERPFVSWMRHSCHQMRRCRTACMKDSRSSTCAWRSPVFQSRDSSAMAASAVTPQMSMAYRLM